VSTLPPSPCHLYSSKCLTCESSSSTPQISEEELPFLVAHLSLFSADGSVALDMGSSPTGTPPRRLLYGNLVASPQRLRDTDGKSCLLFIFSDVSIRWRGQYQLGISLMRISRHAQFHPSFSRKESAHRLAVCLFSFPSVDSNGALSIGDHGTTLAQTRTKPFDVVPHSDYIAARASFPTHFFTLFELLNILLVP
jgi:hypothetical protein